MDDVSYKNYRTEQTLANCGLSEDSINSIQSTRVVTHNGTQHVMKDSQSHLAGEQPSTISENSTQEINSSLANEFRSQQQQFLRFKQHADNRIMQLEGAMTQVIAKLKTATDIINTLKSNGDAAKNRAKLLDHQENEPATEAIDRNRVAPSDVSIEKMFYMGHK